MSDTDLHSSEQTTEDAIASIRRIFPVELHHRLFLVGGSVRDHLMGQSIQDVDLVTDIPAEQLEKHHFHQVQGKSTAPIYFKSHPCFGKFEVTLLEQGQSLETDLKQRDYRCNAVAMTLDGTIIDPLGGQGDIQGKLLVPCSAQTLIKDPIRIFRAFRFECHGWEMTHELVSLIKDGPWDDQFRTISVERFTREMLKAMEGDRPDSFFVRMIELGVGECYLPEIFKMLEIPAGPAKYHGEDTVLSHSIDTLRRMATQMNDSTARLAAFFHDLGKLATLPDQLPRHIGHDIAGVEIARQLAIRIRLPATCNKALAAANKLHLVGGRWNELRDKTKLVLAENARKAGIAYFFPQLVMADRNLEQKLDGWEQVLLISSMSASDLGVNSDMLAAIPERDRKSYINRQKLSALKRRLPVVQEET